MKPDLVSISRRWLAYASLLISVFTLNTIARGSEGVCAETRWIYTRDVVFAADKSFARISLLGSDDIEVDRLVYYAEEEGERTRLVKLQSLVYADMKNFQPGHRMQIAYSREDGPVLLDPASGKYIEIISGLAEHPIDALAERLSRGAITNHLYRESRNAIFDLWEGEIARIYQRLQREFPEGKEDFIAAEAQWNLFLTMDRTARRIASEHHGGRYSEINDADTDDLFRNHALRLAAWGRN